MSLVSINYTASPTSSSITRYVQEGVSIKEYLEDVEGLDSFKAISVEVDGVPADLDDEIWDGMAISIAQKKTASGLSSI